MASFRYRVAAPANELRAYINDLNADVVIFAKPQPEDVERAKTIKAEGRKVVADFCDDHFDWPFYHELADLVDAVTCPTDEMAKVIGRNAVVIPDPFEYPEREPHCYGNNLLWFGNAVNFYSLQRVIDSIRDFPIRVVSNVNGCIPWSISTMLHEFSQADIVIIPATKTYKSPNRAMESIRQGCYVVAEPHPSLNDIPGIWLGDIRKGVEWAAKNPRLANQETLKAQRYISERYSRKTQADAWRKLLAELVSTSAAEKSAGMAG